MRSISIENVAAAIRKVSAMSLAQKEALADEIHQRQPCMLDSCLVQSTLGSKSSGVEFLLRVLLVCYQSMKESGLVATRYIGRSLLRAPSIAYMRDPI